MFDDQTTLGDDERVIPRDDTEAAVHRLLIQLSLRAWNPALRLYPIVGEAPEADGSFALTVTTMPAFNPMRLSAGDIYHGRVHVARHPNAKSDPVRVVWALWEQPGLFAQTNEAAYAPVIPAQVHERSAS